MNAHGPPLDELGQGVDEESLMAVALCEQTPGPSLQNRMKGGFVSAKGWKEKD